MDPTVVLSYVPKKCSWMNVQVTTVTGTVLSAMKPCGFYAHTVMSPHLTFIANVMDVPHPSMYITNLAAAKEDSSSHTTTNFVTNSYTLIDEPFLLTLYTGNPSYTRNKID